MFLCKTIRQFGWIAVLTVAFACKKDNNANQMPAEGLHVVEGSYLADACGNEVVLRGVNVGNVYATDLGATEIEEAAKTGANSIRLVLSRQYQKWENGVPTNKALEASEIEPLIQRCLSHGMIPVLELHDFTGSANVLADLGQAVAWWNSNSIKTMLHKYQHAIILNIANEPDNGTAEAAAYRSANTVAVQELRNGGYTCPIMIDAPDWGKDHTFFLREGRALMDSDPMQNLIFSVHAYWPTIGAFGNYSDATIASMMGALEGTGLPIVLGELAWADIQNNQAYVINYMLLMQQCETRNMGYLVWWWGFTNAGANNQLSMTNNGLYTGLAGAGEVMATTDANSIQKTAKKPCRLNK